MRRVTITQFNFEPDIKTFVRQVLSVMELDAGSARVVRGSDAYLEMPVTDIVTGETIRVSEDPVRWSELLAETVGYGDIEVLTEELAHPATAVAVEPDLAATEALTALVHGH